MSICRKTGAWLHADEVYRGTELAGDETPSFWGMYERVICVNSMSKAYGLAGLRIGWAVASPEMIEELWRRHEYAVIAAAGPEHEAGRDCVATCKAEDIAGSSEETFTGRARRAGAMGAPQEGRFRVSKAVATSIAFVGYNFDMPSAELADHIRRKASVLVAPGAYLGTENHLRITVGYEPRKKTALERIGVVAAELAQMPSTAHS